MGQEPRQRCQGRWANPWRIGIAVDFADEKRATENEQKLADARRDITSQFRSIAKDIEIQFQAQVGQVEDQVYGPLTGQIQTLQESEMTGIGAANEGVKAVNATKGELKSLLQKIRDEVHNQVN